MANIYNVEPSELIEKTAEELKKLEEIKPPEWASFVKTSMSKERPPARDDWWHVRAASLLRKVYRHGPIGVSKLRRKYGSKKNRGVRPEKFYKASGNIIRKIMQQLTKAELVKEAKKGVHKGRIITPKGILLLSKAADSLSSKKPVKEEKKEKPAKEVKTTENKVNDIIKKAKEVVEKKEPTAEKLVKEIKEEPKEKVPSAHDLAKKNG